MCLKHLHVFIHVFMFAMGDMYALRFSFLKSDLISYYLVHSGQHVHCPEILPFFSQARLRLIIETVSMGGLHSALSFGV